MIEVSVIVPTFNRSESLENALDSLLKQSFDSKKFEVIVVDDAGNDKSKEVFEKFKLKKKESLYIRNKENAGPGTSRNVGTKKAKGKIVAFFDDDCIASRDWLKELLRTFREVPDAQVTHGVTYSRCPMLRPFVHAVNCQYHLIATANAAVKKEIFEKIGGFDPIMSRWAEDNELERRLRDSDTKIVYNRKAAVLHPPRYVPYSLKKMIFPKKRFIAAEYYMKKHPKSGFSSGFYVPIILRFLLRFAFAAAILLMPLDLIEKALIILGSFWLHGLYRVLRTHFSLRKTEWNVRIKAWHALQFILLNWIVDFYNFFALLSFKAFAGKKIYGSLPLIFFPQSLLRLAAQKARLETQSPLPPHTRYRQPVSCMHCTPELLSDKRIQ
jgi:glycosyltransferase involved in cell wall biosynthesis